ncbi:MAG TPA: cation transporter [Candidatus Bathyarchaeia archaeon]|nr:cation transporter [Candidatus Bathyarchaeia archaeon]
MSSPQWSLRLGRGLLLEYASVVWMTVESIVAVVAGVVAGSLALVTFGGDSIIELISAAAVAYYLRKLRKGSVEERILHRTERITSVLLFALIPVVGLGAVYSFFSGIRAESSILGTIIAMGAVLIMPVLWVGKLRIGRETGCLPLSTDAVESATCFLMSIILLAGLVTISFFGLWWVDYLATGLILVFVVREAVESIREGKRVE